MKKSVLLSIIGVLLVIGVGITFAYFSSGVEVSGEGSTVELEPGDMIKVTYDAGDNSLSSNNLVPGQTLTKTFTVTVTPTSKENTASYSIYLDLTDNTFVKCDDSNYNSITNACIKDYEELTYTFKNQEGEVLSSDNLIGATGKILLASETKTVDKETTYEYTMEIEFHETNADQNHNMDKIINGSIEVEFGMMGNEYILASANAPTATTTDWTGETTYYYIGNPNNWVQFAGFWWRIIRINGDGTIRMIYQGTSANTTGTGTQIGTSAFNSSDNNKTYVGLVHDGTNQHGYGQPSTVMNMLNNWYNNNLVNYEAAYIDTGVGFCSDRNVANGDSWNSTIFNYAPYERIAGSASLKCSTEDILSQDNGKLPNPIGLITSDEYILSGNSASFLNVDVDYWTMSPGDYYSGSGVIKTYGGKLISYGLTNIEAVRPVINLRADVSISGLGTTSDPFKVVGVE